LFPFQKLLISFSFYTIRFILIFFFTNKKDVLRFFQKKQRHANSSLPQTYKRTSILFTSPSRNIVIWFLLKSYFWGGYHRNFFSRIFLKFYLCDPPKGHSKPSLSANRSLETRHSSI
jgi:hypothetical protein